MTPDERAEECRRLAVQARDCFCGPDYADLARQCREMAKQVEELGQTSTAPPARPARERLLPMNSQSLPMNSKAKLHYRDLKRAMSEETVRRHLAEAERHVQAGARTIDRQRRALAKLDELGRDTADAKTLLATLEDIQNTFLRHREVMLSERRCLERPIPTPPAPEGAAVVRLFR